MRPAQHTTIALLLLTVVSGCGATRYARRSSDSIESNFSAPSSENDSLRPTPGPPPPAPPAVGVSHVKRVGFLQELSGETQCASESGCTTGFCGESSSPGTLRSGRLFGCMRKVKNLFGPKSSGCAEEGCGASSWGTCGVESQIPYGSGHPQSQETEVPPTPIPGGADPLPPIAPADPVTKSNQGGQEFLPPVNIVPQVNAPNGTQPIRLFQPVPLNSPQLQGSGHSIRDDDDQAYQMPAPWPGHELKTSTVSLRRQLNAAPEGDAGTVIRPAYKDRIR